MLNKINTLITKLQNTNSQNDKLFILSQYKNDNDITTFFKYCYDPNILFNITSKSLKDNPNLSEFEFFDSIFDLCNLLIKHNYAGNKAISLINGFINGNNQYEELLYNFFDKNLKIGMNITQINKALNNIIPIFNVALAETYDEKKHNSYNLDSYFIQRKMNGLRMLTFITYKDNKINISFKSRKGKDFTTMNKIIPELTELYKDSLYYGKDIILDGEVCIIDYNGKEDWNRAVSEAKRKNHTIYNPRYVCFDILTPDEFYGIKQSLKYEKRYTSLKKFLSINTKLEHLQLVFSVPYTEEHKNKLLEEFVETDRWEGFIYRKNTIFKAGRSTDLLKYKLFKDTEFTVIDVETTKKPMLNSNNIMEDTDCIGALIFEYKNNKVKVGSGLTDKQRIDWYKNKNEIIGKQILVKYKEETKNQDGTVSLQFPVLKYVFDSNRDF